MSQGGSIDLNRFLPLFFEEAQEHLAVLERGLVAAEQSTDPRTIIDDCFRAAHSLKGSSGSLGLTPIVDLTHVLESRLDAVRRGDVLLDRQLAGRLLVGVDLLAKMLASLSSGEDGAVPGVAEWIAAPEAALEPTVSPGGPGPTDAAPATALILAAHLDAFRCGIDPLPFLRDLDMLAGITTSALDVDRIPVLEELDPQDCHLTWTFTLAEPVSDAGLADLFGFADHVLETRRPVPEPAPAAAPPPAATRPASPPPSAPHPSTVVKQERATLRIATDKVDKLVDLVGELVISQAILGEMLSELGAGAQERIQNAFATLERNTREVQERAMGIRMLPVAVAFDRMPRLVRDLGDRLGKDMRVVIEGEDTELDRSVLEHLTDPLTHLVRNSADHGLEAPDERVAAGKDRTGTITVRAMHEGSSVVIEVADDGRGLDHARIRARAESRGLIAPNAALSADEIVELLFTPGFSTAESVSDVSGRGVGMDVVRHGIETLGGRVSLSSTPGRGTAVRMSFPLTLAIVEGLCVRVADATYVVPMLSVTGSMRPNEGDIRGVLGRGEVVIAQGRQMPLVRLSRVLAVPAETTDASTGLLVLVQHDGDHAALWVDHITGSTQAVIKNLERNFQRVEGVMGATILGDGRVALVLDIAGVLRLALGRGRGGRTRLPTNLGESPCMALP